MKQYRDEYIEIIKTLNGDVLGQNKALSYIEDSDIWAYNEPVPFSYVPNLVGSKDDEFFRKVCTTMHGILVKVIDCYLEDEEYREIFQFAPDLERLILLPCDYDEKLPIGRFDLFINEEDFSFKFCEFNTDGSGAMSRDLEVGHALQRGETYQEFSKRYEVEQYELFDSWVQAFMRNYRQCPYAKENPTIAVTDFYESGVFSDFNRFIAAFERAGYSARFVDVREFKFDGEHLIDPADGTVIDAIYRRSVTSEILQHPGECDAMIEAVEARKVCLIGHFRNTVVHSKIVSVALFDPRTRAFLTDDECAFVDAHVPRTYRLQLDSGIDIDQIKANKNAWIIKPEDDYGAHGVYPGIDQTDSEWEKIIDKHLNARYVAQEYCNPYEVELMVPSKDGTNKVELWQAMPGMYIYNGELAGFYCRYGQEGIIALDHGGICAPTFKVDVHS